MGEEEGDGSSNVKEKEKRRTEEAKEKEAGGLDVRAEGKRENVRVTALEFRNKSIKNIYI